MSAKLQIVWSLRRLLLGLVTTCKADHTAHFVPIIGSLDELRNEWFVSYTLGMTIAEVANYIDGGRR